MLRELRPARGTTCYMVDSPKQENLCKTLSLYFEEFCTNILTS